MPARVASNKLRSEALKTELFKSQSSFMLQLGHVIERGRVGGVAEKITQQN
jgi:hypothetical protein